MQTQKQVAVWNNLSSLLETFDINQGKNVF